MDIFKAKSHAFMVIYLRAFPFFLLTLISQTELDTQRPNWDATKASGFWCRNLEHAFF